MEFLIIGAGIAGSALAILLGRQGRTVGLFERERFPREKPCGEGLMPAGVAVIERLGLRRLSGGLPFEGIRYHRDGRSVAAKFPLTRGLPNYGLGQRRRVLDLALFKAAATTPGVEVYAGAPLDSLLREGDRISGAIIGGDAQRAKITIGADGANSRTRSLLRWSIPALRKRIGARAHFRLARGRGQAPFVSVFLLDGCELYVTPLPGGEVCVAALADAHLVRGSLDAAFKKWCNTPPEMAEQLEGALQTTELMARSPLETGSLRGSAPGVVLLGDASGSTDPITGGGMAQGLLSAALLARYLSRQETGDPKWLAAFERDRRTLLRDYRRVTRMVLWLSGRPRAAALGFEVVRGFPSLLSQLVGVCAGLRPLAGVHGAAERLLPEILGDQGAAELRSTARSGFQAGAKRGSEAVF